MSFVFPFHLFTVVLGVVYVLLVFLVKDYIGYIFTNEKDVVEAVASVLPYTAMGLLQISFAVCLVTKHIMRLHFYTYSIF